MRQGSVSCPNCNTPLYGAPPPQNYQGQVTYGTTYPGYPTAYAAPGQPDAGANKARRTKATQQAVGGAVLLGIGLLFVIGNLTSGGRGYIFFTPLLFGFIYLVRGLVGLGSIPK